MKYLSAWGILFALLMIVESVSGASIDPAIKYVENKGQWGADVRYSADIAGGDIYIKNGSFTYAFYDTEAMHRRHEGYDNTHGHLPVREYSECSGDQDQLRYHIFEATFLNANPKSLRPEQSYPTLYNYFYGSDPESWVSAAKSYGRIVYEEIYSSIDLVAYSSGFNMKYDFIVRPEGDAQDIRIAYEGLENMSLEDGSLILTTSVNQVQEYKPYAYQDIDGHRNEVQCRYVLQGNEVHYEFPQGYDDCYELIIDPILIFSTYSGSPADNWGNTATYGENGKLYSGGIANHFRNNSFLGQFPATPGAYQTSWGGIWDVAILKYDSAGSVLEYATYLGGSGSEVPVSMIINSEQELVILGVTNSENFPVRTSAYQTAFGGGSDINTILGTNFINGSDMFIAKLSKDGSQLTASTYFGGGRNDGLNITGEALTRNYGDQQRGEVFVDEDDNVYLSASAGSVDLFNTESTSFNPIYGGGNTDAVVAKFDAQLTNLIWGGYLGGSRDDAGFSIKVDSAQNVYAAGGTESFDFPMHGNSLNQTYLGGVDGWVGYISSGGDYIINTTYIGTSSYDQVYFLDLDSDEDVYLLGQTRGDYPITPGKYGNPGAGQFIHKLSKNLENTLFTTAFGSEGRREPNISLTAFLVNDCNNLYVAGWGNNSGNFNGSKYMELSTLGLPVTENAFSATTEGQDFYLMVLDSDANSLLYGTFFGGSEAAIHVDGGTSRFDKSGIVYHSVCASCLGGSSFPVTSGAWSATNGANGGCNNAAFKFDIASLRARLKISSDIKPHPITSMPNVCIPDHIEFANLSVGGKRYEWTFGDGEGITLTDTSRVVHYYKTPGVYTVILKAIDEETCIGKDVASLQVMVSQGNFAVGDDGNICEGDTYQLEAYGGVQYFWLSGDGLFESTFRTPIVAPTLDTDYYVTIVDENTCVGRDTVKVEVVPKVVVDFEYLKMHDCFSRPAVKFKSLSGDADSFVWSLGNGITKDEREFVYNYEQDGVYNVSLTATREFCTYEKRINLPVSTLRVPNIMTPDIPGYNDTFLVEFGGKVDIKVYNRWGKKVYEMDDYDGQWDGGDHPAGVYYYEADISNETVCKGWLHIIR